MGRERKSCGEKEKGERRMVVGGREGEREREGIG